MFRKLSLAGAALAATLLSTVPASAQQYDRYGNAYGYSQGRGYDAAQGRYDGRNVYQGRNYQYDNRAARKCRDGDGGTIIGAIAGGLLGNGIAGRGDRTLGTILGGAIGAVAGRSIDRSDRPGYCR